jgi:hypothetical protein
MSSSIIVKLISNNSIYPDLQLQSTDSKSSTSLIIGRNEQTKIKSTHCAREQGSKSANHFTLDTSRTITSFRQSCIVRLLEPGGLDPGPTKFNRLGPGPKNLIDRVRVQKI